MEILYSLVVIFGIDGEKHSVEIQNELTKTLCSRRAALMVDTKRYNMLLPFYVDDAHSEIHSVEGMKYMCIPTNVRAKE